MNISTKEIRVAVIDTLDDYGVETALGIVNSLTSLIQSAIQEARKETPVDHTIDVRHEPDALKAFDKFIQKWCGDYYPHLIDSDDNDGEFMRNKIRGNHHE